MPRQDETIGAPLPRFEDERLLTGAGCFTDDTDLEDQAWAAFVRSPHAHAVIDAIDSAVAAAMPGVRGVYTAVDMLANGVRRFPTDVDTRGRDVPNRDGSLMADPDCFPMATGRARHVGDPVAMVVADTQIQADLAAEAVSVAWSPLPSVTDTARASSGDAPLLWDCAPGNVCFDWVAGDEAATAAAIAAADHVTTLSMVNNRIITCFLEPRAAVGSYDPAAGAFLIHVGCQSLHALQRRIALSLDVPPDRVRVVTGDVGGGFGSRNVIYPEYVAVLWAARALGRPVKWTARRDEEFHSSAQARDTLLRGTLALGRDGDFLGLRVDSVCNLGAYHSGNGPFTQLRNLTRMLPGIYRTPALYLELKGVFSNTVPISSYRGVGRMEAITLMERLIDAAARETGHDRVALRRRNAIPAAAMPYATPAGAIYDSGDYGANMTLAMEAAGWEGFVERRAAAARRGRLRGIGLSNYIEGAGGVPDEYAGITVDPGGAVSLRAGCLSQGQGHETTLRQIVAAQLGMPPERIAVTANDTALIPAGVGTNASRSMVRAGTALVEAAREVIETGADTAAELLEAARADIAFADGAWRVAGTDRAVTLEDVAAAAGGLAAERYHRSDATTYPTGCHVCEVEIDPETGAVEIVAFAAVDDVGRAINPMIVHGQSQGGIAQGIGQALLENGHYDPATGQLLSGSFMDYAVPRADDLPPIEPIGNDAPSPTNPLGVKGAGEGGTTGAPAAVMNAILDALRPLGVTSLDMPATPHTVWRAIRAVETRGA